MPPPPRAARRCSSAAAGSQASARPAAAPLAAAPHRSRRRRARSRAGAAAAAAPASGHGRRMSASHVARAGQGLRRRGRLAGERGRGANGAGAWRRCGRASAAESSLPLQDEDVARLHLDQPARDRVGDADAVKAPRASRPRAARRTMGLLTSASLRGVGQQPCALKRTQPPVSTASVRARRAGSGGASGGAPASFNLLAADRSLSAPRPTSRPPRRRLRPGEGRGG